jgi:hypothetical protein
MARMRAPRPQIISRQTAAVAASKAPASNVPIAKEELWQVTQITVGDLTNHRSLKA